MLGTEGKLRFAALSLPDGQSWIRQFDGEGRIRMTSGGPGDGHHLVHLFDENGVPRISSGTTTANEAFFQISAPDRSVLQKTNSLPTGTLAITPEEK